VKDPHHRIIAAQQAIEQGKKPKDAKVADIILAFTSGKGAKEDLIYAVSIFLESYQRAVLDALCLGRATTEEIFDATEIPHKVVVAYQDYFFDQDVFKNNLDRITWVRGLQDYLVPDELQLLQAAITVGPRYLVWLLTGRGKFTPTEVLRFSMNDAMFRGFAHRNAPLDSAVAQEAHRWIRTAERLAKTLHGIDPQDQEEAAKQLRIALTYDDTTVNAETSGISPDQILH
jgi:hypothetical protein